MQITGHFEHGSPKSDAEVFRKLSAPHTPCQQMRQNRLSISRAAFEENMADKLKKLSFSSDILPLLPATISYHQNEAYKHVHEKIISKIPGEAWNG